MEYETVETTAKKLFIAALINFNEDFRQSYECLSELAGIRFTHHHVNTLLPIAIRELFSTDETQIFAYNYLLDNCNEFEQEIRAHLALLENYSNVDKSRFLHKLVHFILVQRFYYKLY